MNLSARVRFGALNVMERTGFTGPSRTTNTVHRSIPDRWGRFIVEHHIHIVHINTPGSHIGSYEQVQRAGPERPALL